MDAGTWKTISQIVVFGGAVLAALGGLGSWYFARLEEDAKEKRASDRHASLSGQLDTLGRRLAPFEELAQQRFPDLAGDAALQKLREELAQVRELATRDIPKAPTPDLYQGVLQNLRTLVRERRAPSLTILNLHNVNTPGAGDFFDRFQVLLRSAAVQFRVAIVTGMSFTMPKPPPYVIRFAPGAQEQARWMAEALRPLIVSTPVLELAQTALQSGGVEITFQGQLDFRADGSVAFR